MTKDEALTLEALKYAASKGYGRIVREMKIAPFTIKGDEALAQPAPPPECKTEAEQTAYAFGWWKALESVRTGQPAQGPVAQAWDEGYRAGIDDERTSDANIGIAGMGMKVEPARNNPYRTTPPQRKPLTDAQVNECGMCGYVGKDKDKTGQCPKCRWDELRPLTGKAHQKPLTDDQIYEMYNEPRSDAEMLEFARAIEAAHGIKGEA